MIKEQRIHDASMEILRDIGIKFHNQEAIAILKDNGITVQDNIAFFTEEQAMHWMRMAPSSFTLHARNSRYNMTVGGDAIHPSLAYGCAFMAERDGRQRPGTTLDYVNCVKLVQTNKDFSLCGGIIIQLGDAPEETTPIDMFYAAATRSDKALLLSTGKKHIMESLMRAGCELFGGEQEMIEKPRMITLINTNSPLSLDPHMTDCLMVFARYGQPVIVAPSTMLGTTGPITLAGTLALGNAENIAAIALAQMIRPGTPVVYGMQSTALDMKNAQYACAAPEGTILQGFGARMARFYSMPSRGGGSLTDSPVVNAQAGYESMMTFFSAYRSKINLVLEAGGVLAGVKATSYDKMLCDFEIIRLVKRCFAPLEVDDMTLALEDIRDVGHDGDFLTAENTLELCKDLFFPTIGSREAADSAYFEENLDKEYDRRMKEYETLRSEMDPTQKSELRKFLCTANGMDSKQLERIDTL